MVFMVVAAAQDSQTEKWIASINLRWRNTKPGSIRSRLPSWRIFTHAPNSYEIHELLGVVYASLSEDAKAIPHLELAVRLKPDSSEARTSLAATSTMQARAPKLKNSFAKPRR